MFCWTMLWKLDNSCIILAINIYTYIYMCVCDTYIYERFVFKNKMFLPQEAITREHSANVAFVMETIIYVIAKAEIFCIIHEGTSIPWNSINKHIQWNKSSYATILDLLSRWFIFKSLWSSAATWRHRSGSTIVQGPLLLTWFNFNPSMDK